MTKEKYIRGIGKQLKVKIHAHSPPGGEPEHSAAFETNIRATHITMF